MRLLNVYSFQLKEFLDSSTRFYAILSHRWEEEEVSFQDLVSSGVTFPPNFDHGEPSQNRTIAALGAPACTRKGFAKLVGFCEQARAEGFEWAWMDTCCIDKSSSAELSEAINSMFQWYADAPTCYAYLSDVCSDEDPAAAASSFRESKWFSRGWTLQEMIAPADVVFLASDWNEIGTRQSLAEVISEISAVDVVVLMEPHRRNEFSFAHRMSWAARRVTTRIEDQAYCLLGLFDINMPLLYGEGRNAFVRLQMEIMDGSDDTTLLAWSSETVVDTPLSNLDEFHVDQWGGNPSRRMTGPYSGLLSNHVSGFRNCTGMLKLPSQWRQAGMKVKKPSIKLTAPVFGPLNPSTTRRGSLGPQQLSPRQSRALCRTSLQFDTPFRHLWRYVSPKIGTQTPWGDIELALVGMRSCSCSLAPTSGTSCHCARYIGILLRRPSGELVTRHHWPSMLTVSLTAELETLMAWPLTTLQAAIRFGDDLSGSRLPSRLTVPAGYSPYIPRDRDDAVPRFSHRLDFKYYGPGRPPYRVAVAMPQPYCYIQFWDSPAESPLSVLFFHSCHDDPSVQNVRLHRNEVEEAAVIQVARGHGMSVTKQSGFLSESKVLIIRVQRTPSYYLYSLEVGDAKAVQVPKRSDSVATTLVP